MCVYLNELFHLTHTTNGTGLKIDLLSAVSAVFFCEELRNFYTKHDAIAQCATHTLALCIHKSQRDKETPNQHIPTHIGYLFKKNILYGVCVCVGHSKGN